MCPQVLALAQGQATERMERLNLNMENEAIVMRIITLVTLVSLMITFDNLTFLSSTDISRSTYLLHSFR
jgi:hypothetical protein